MFVIVSFVAGILLGFGLLLGGMVDPNLTLAFLDVTDHWNPTVGIITGVATLISYTGFAYIYHRQSSFLNEPIEICQNKKIDRRLVVGSTLFGVGLGLTGLCLAPSLVLMGTGNVVGFVFVVSAWCGYKFLGLLEENYLGIFSDKRVESKISLREF